MRFLNRTTNQQLNIAIAYADSLLSDHNSPMHKELEKKNDWKYGPEKTLGVEVSMDLYNGPLDVNIFLYRPKYPFTSAIAMTKKNDPSIYFNVYKLTGKTPVNLLVGTILHEYSHKCGFNHNSLIPPSNYRTKDKNNYSVPYWLTTQLEQGRWV